MEGWAELEGRVVKFLTMEEMRNMPPPKWIFHELLQENSTSLLYGPSGLGKSFVALELVCSLATQVASIFRPERDGLVIYVAAEGVAGLGMRLKAWEIDRSTIIHNSNVAFLGQAVNLGDEHNVDRFIKAIRETFGDRRPILIIFDTLARCAVGLDENSAKDMGIVVAHLELIRQAFDCTVMLVHHSTKASPKTERGSGALYGAVDTVLSLLRNGIHLKLECPKQKNGERTPTRRLDLKVVQDSCVLDAKKVAKERDQLEQLQAVHVDAELTALNLPKRVYIRDAYPPRVWDWDGDVPVCGVDISGSKVMIEREDPDGAHFKSWLMGDLKFRQEERGERAEVHPFAYTVESQEWWTANAQARKEIMEKRRQVRDDRMNGRGTPYPAISDMELAWWVWGVCDLRVSQADVMRYTGIARGMLQREKESWEKYGLLRFLPTKNGVSA